MAAKSVRALGVALITILACLLLSTLGFAKPKPATRTYKVSCSEVWKVTKVVVREHYDVLNLNDQEQAGSFTTGSIWSGVRPIAFSLSGTGDTCTVSVTGHFSGLIHDDKGDFFRRIQEALNEATSNAASQKVQR